ncbi:LOW QUALITY PROTEIN: hypothetical protein ACHAW5_011350 [Stephanodiscus triporus]|uniref:Rhodanese domain-containing protein n=1 Tax=Stephanodiscus triporus TaxID=2934178 RepID=A0ABD3QQT2_9STRA
MHDRLMMYDSMHCSFMNVKKPPAELRRMLSGLRDQDHVGQRKVVRECRAPEHLRSTHFGRDAGLEQNVSCVEYNHLRKNGQPHVLLDVRVARQYEMCSLDGSINLPLELLESQLETVGLMSKGELPVFLHLSGIALRRQLRSFKKSIEEGNAVHSVYNIAGGLNSWVETVDSEFPRY